jgi:hypothetical protein
MCRKLPNAAWILLALTLATGEAQSPAGDPAAQVQTATLQPMSQPGAQGKLVDFMQPAVPVPPGPVPASKIKPAPPTPIAQKKAELGDDDTWDPQWDVFIEENLPPELLSSQVAKDVHPFCPRFSKLRESDKRAYWAYFFQALAGAEAGLRTTANVRHSDPTVAVRDRITHRTVRQEGLLQLTYMDTARYGCDFDWDADKHLGEHNPDKTILQPRNNLLCGIRILKNQLIDLQQPLVTRKSYWGTLHPGTLSYKVFARQMANVPVACVRPTHQRAPEQPALGIAAANWPGQPADGTQP